MVQTVTDSAFVYYDSIEVVVYKDAQGNPVSTVTSYKGEKHEPTSASSSAPPPPPPTPTSSPSPPPAAEEKIAEPVHHAPAQQSPAQQAPAASPSSQAPPPAAQSSSGKPSGGSGGGKKAKGVAYNTAAQVAQVSDAAWGCNWAQLVDLNPVPNGFEYVPQLWGKKTCGTGDDSTDDCKNFGRDVHNANASYALFYNEPDMPFSAGGSQLDVGTVIPDFHTYMQPLQAQGVKVSSPCVAANDVEYLKTFLAGIKGNVDVLCFHWYGPSVDSLTKTVNIFKQVASDHKIGEVWMNEWAAQPPPPSLSDFTGYLDNAIDRYAYNMNDMLSSTGY